MKYLSYLLCVLSLFFFNNSISQDKPTQIVKGDIIDNLGEPIIGATIKWLGDTINVNGTVTDIYGEFSLQNIPVGRQSFLIESVQYQNQLLENIIVTSTKEVILKIVLEPDVLMMNDIVVVSKQVGDAGNQFTKVSSIPFNVSETDLYAGSRGDPARMASNFAGVQGADDSRNDLIIRGNSPLGVVNLVEGLPVPNLNHFAVPGSTGGPVSILNNKTLDNSAFYTGAFPAQYGNALAGVFDLNLKSGNDQTHEFSAQLGFLGTEIFAEGPISKGKSSYLATYRYSTLDLFNGLGIQIGTDALPRYQDAAFNIKLIGNEKIKVNFFGLGGTSKINIQVSGKNFKDIIENEGTYSEVDRDQEFSTEMIMTGLNAKWTIGKSTPVEAAFSFSNTKQGAVHYLTEVDQNDIYIVSDPSKPYLDYSFSSSKIAGVFDLTHEFENRSLLNAGFLFESNFYLYRDKILTEWDTNDPDYGSYTTRWDTDDQASLIQSYIQYKSNISDKLDLSIGVHAQYHSLNNSTSLFEPRASLNYNPNKYNRWSLAYGQHSQTQPDYVYFYEGNQGVPYNRDLDFTKNTHLIAGYEARGEKSKLRFKSEVYYQWLSQIPIYDDVSSSYSLANMGSGFSRLFPEEMVNNGEGRNFGMEITLEKAFSKGYYYLISASLYDSKYVGGDGVWRDTEFNGNYVLNLLTGKEFETSKASSIFVGGKFTTAGGRRYGPIDLVASEEFREIAYVDDLRNSEQFSDYLRFDINVNYKINRAKVNHEIGLDLVNVTNRTNLLKLTYIPPVGGDINPLGETREEGQLGFLPVFFYKLSF